MKVGLIISGAPKSGTTSMFEALSGIPGYCAPSIKETNFFSGINSTLTRSVATEEEYHQLFPNEGSVRFEASPSYMYILDAAKNIYAYNANVKILFLLREPVDRAYSHFLMDVNRFGARLPCFRECMYKGYIERTGVWGTNINPYSGLSLYYEHVQRFKNIFDHNILVLPFEGLAKNDPLVIERLIRFLGIESSAWSGLPAVNQSVQSRALWVTRILMSERLKSLRFALSGSIKPVIKKIIYKGSRSRLGLDNLLRDELRLMYREDVNKLSKLTGFDFYRYWYE